MPELPPDVNLDLFEPFDRLVRIRIRGRDHEVPENNTILRGVQFLFGDAVSAGRFCWNNECGNCEVVCRSGGRDGGRRVRGCQVVVEEGMEIDEVAPDVALFIRD